MEVSQMKKTNNQKVAMRDEWTTVFTKFKMKLDKIGALSNPTKLQQLTSSSKSFLSTVRLRMNKMH